MQKSVGFPSGMCPVQCLKPKKVETHQAG